MSDHSDLRPTDPTLRTRVLMGGAFVGALIALSLSWVFSWVPESPEVVAQREAKEHAEKVAEVREKAFRSPPGSCLQWTQEDAGDVHKVSCSDEHLFEVVGLADLSSEHGRHAPMPDDDEWRSLTETHCGELVEDYLDGPLDPEGRLTIGVLRPDDKQWGDGDRTLHCGLQWVGPGGGLQTLTESAKELDQSNVWRTGTCLGIAGKGVGDPAPCEQPHAYEIVGVVDLGDEFDSYPSKDKQNEWLDPTCAEVVEDYTGGKSVADLAKDGLILTWDVRAEKSWEAGSTLVNCKVGAVLEDGSGLAPVQGSVKDSEEDEKSDEKEKDKKKDEDVDEKEDDDETSTDGPGGEHGDGGSDPSDGAESEGTGNESQSGG